MTLKRPIDPSAVPDLILDLLTEEDRARGAAWILQALQSRGVQVYGVHSYERGPWLITRYRVDRALDQLRRARAVVVTHGTTDRATVHRGRGRLYAAAQPPIASLRSPPSQEPPDACIP